MKSTLEASSKASHQIAQQVYTYPAYISKVEPKKKISNISSWTFAGLGAGSLPPPARPLCQQDRLSSARYQTAKVPSVLISSFISHCSNVSDLTFLNWTTDFLYSPATWSPFSWTRIGCLIFQNKLVGSETLRWQKVHNLGDVERLEVFSASYNFLESLPESFARLTSLRSFGINHF